MEQSVLSPNASEAFGESVVCNWPVDGAEVGEKGSCRFLHSSDTFIYAQGEGRLNGLFGFFLCMNFRGNIYHDVS